ncbi:MAG: diacylglycerol kinase family protein [Candidatus Shapirobacteria bacterium]|jgi:diacylglycerol kinase
MLDDLNAFFMSFVYAKRGVIHGSAHGRNMKIHTFFALLVILFALLFELSSLEWFIVLICIGVVLAAELFNSAIEDLCNLVRDCLKLPYSATTHARDMAAGAVLVLSLISAVIGVWIFLPKFISLIF